MNEAEITNAYEIAGVTITPSLQVFISALAERFATGGIPLEQQEVMVADLARAAAAQYVPPPPPPRPVQLSQFGQQTAVLSDQYGSSPMNAED